MGYGLLNNWIIGWTRRSFRNNTNSNI